MDWEDEKEYLQVELEASHFLVSHQQAEWQKSVPLHEEFIALTLLEVLGVRKGEEKDQSGIQVELSYYFH